MNSIFDNEELGLEFLNNSDFWLTDIKNKNIDESIEKIMKTDNLFIKFANLDKIDYILQLLHDNNVDLTGKNIVIG